MTKVKTVWYDCVVTVTVTIVWKRQHLSVICRKHLSDVGDEMWLVLIAFVFLWDPKPIWLLFNELKNKACHYSLIVAQFCVRYIQVKDNEIAESGSLEGDCVCFIQVTAICWSTSQYCKYKGLFLGSCAVTAIYKAVIYRFDCKNRESQM